MDRNLHFQLLALFLKLIKKIATNYFSMLFLFGSAFVCLTLFLQ